MDMIDKMDRIEPKGRTFRTLTQSFLFNPLA